MPASPLPLPGDMALSQNRGVPGRAGFAARHRIDRERLYGLRQVHSRNVQVIDRQTAGEIAAIEADGLLSAEADAVLSVTVADCLPIFLVDRRTGAFGVVHSGWRGTGIVREALAVLSSRFGSRPGDVTVVVGPGIGSCCYAVPEERAAFFASEYGPGTVLRGEDGRPRLGPASGEYPAAARGGRGGHPRDHRLHELFATAGILPPPGACRIHLDAGLDRPAGCLSGNVKGRTL